MPPQKPAKAHSRLPNWGELKRHFREDHNCVEEDLPPDEDGVVLRRIRDPRLQRLTDTWPRLPNPADIVVPIPPTNRGNARGVSGVPLEIIYVTSATGLHVVTVRASN